MKILKTILILLLSALAMVIVGYFAMQSDFAKHTKSSDGDIYKMKNRVAKERFYSTKLEINKNNNEIVSLGDFTVNLNDRKLIMKISVSTDRDTIDDFLNNQSVIRDDVINTIMRLNGKKISQPRISQAIKDTLNSRYRSENVKDVYFEKFIVH